MYTTEEITLMDALLKYSVQQQNPNFNLKEYSKNFNVDIKDVQEAFNFMCIEGNKDQILVSEKEGYGNYHIVDLKNRVNAFITNGGFRNYFLQNIPYKVSYPAMLKVFSRSKDGLNKDARDERFVNNDNEYNTFVSRYLNMDKTEIYDGFYRVFSKIERNSSSASTFNFNAPATGNFTGGDNAGNFNNSGNITGGDVQFLLNEKIKENESLTKQISELDETAKRVGIDLTIAQTNLANAQTRELRLKVLYSIAGGIGGILVTIVTAYLLGLLHLHQ